jgi:steroid delta-isomerase-like uncharacterized protein
MGQARNVLDKLTAAVEAHSVDTAMGLYADNGVVTTPDAGEVRGREQIGDYWRQFIDGFPDVKYVPISRLEAGNKAVDEGWFEGTNTKPMKTPSGQTLPATGKHVKVRSCDVATVEKGKITEHHMYFDQKEFLSQLGLEEPSR